MQSADRPHPAPLSLSLHPWASPSEGPGAVSFGARERFNPQSPDPFPTSLLPQPFRSGRGARSALPRQSLHGNDKFPAGIIRVASGPGLGGRVRPAPAGRLRASMGGLAGASRSRLHPLGCGPCTGRDLLIPGRWPAFCLGSAGAAHLLSYQLWRQSPLCLRLY